MIKRLCGKFGAIKHRCVLQTLAMFAGLVIESLGSMIAIQPSRGTKIGFRFRFLGRVDKANRHLAGIGGKCVFGLALPEPDRFVSRYAANKLLAISRLAASF